MKGATNSKSVVLKGQDVILATPVRVGGPPAPLAPIDVQIRKQGDLVESLRVVCPCGRSVEIPCLYDSGTPESPAPNSEDEQS